MSLRPPPHPPKSLEVLQRMRHVAFISFGAAARQSNSRSLLLEKSVSNPLFPESYPWVYSDPEGFKRDFKTNKRNTEIAIKCSTKCETKSCEFHNIRWALVVLSTKPLTISKQPKLSLILSTITNCERSLSALRNNVHALEYVVHNSPTQMFVVGVQIGVCKLWLRWFSGG